MILDPDETVTLYGEGRMTLRSAAKRVMAHRLRGLDATVFRYHEPFVVELVDVEQLVANWARR